MASVRYSKYEGGLDDLDMADLMKLLQDRLMQSGYERNPYEPDPNYRPTMQDLYDAIAEALVNNQLVNESLIEQAMDAQNWLDTELGATVKELARRLEQEGYLRPDGAQGDPNLEPQQQGGAAGPNTDPGHATFQLTDKAIDFLGYRTIRDVLGGAGRSSVGAHDTHFVTTGVETVGESKEYEYGDTLNLDIAGTLGNAARHGFQDGKLTLEEEDLQVLQSEYYSSAATVVMLDCSHSMILYGEDRFTPAKQVAVALAHLLFNVPLAVWILEGFMSGVPREIDETAYIDGYSFPRFFLTIFLPLIKSGVGVAAFFCFMFSWVELLMARTLTSVNAKPIVAIMTRTVSAAGMDWATLAAAGTLTIVPGALVIWFVRNYIAKGFALGRV